MSEAKMADLWEEFKTFLAEDDVSMRRFLNRDYDFEGLDIDLTNFALFLEEQYKKRFGIEKHLYFISEVDREDCKYNQIKVVKIILLNGKTYEVVINSYDCRWGSIAESREDFNKAVEDFLNDTKERLDNLTAHLLVNGLI